MRGAGAATKGPAGSGNHRWGDRQRRKDGKARTRNPVGQLLLAHSPQLSLQSAGIRPRRTLARGARSPRRYCQPPVQCRSTATGPPGTWRSATPNPSGEGERRVAPALRERARMARTTAVLLALAVVPAAAAAQRLAPPTLRVGATIPARVSWRASDVALAGAFVVATAAGAVAAAALGDGFLVEPTALEVTHHDLPVPGLAPALAGLRLACVADVHLHRGVPAPARAALAALGREQPDVVALIGDICNQRSDLPTLVAWAREARGTTATVATLGNWEHHAGIDRAAAERAYGYAGVELLYNSVARVTRGGAGLVLVGIDDPV